MSLVVATCTTHRKPIRGTCTETRRRSPVVVLYRDDVRQRGHGVSKKQRQTDTVRDEYVTLKNLNEIFRNTTGDRIQRPRRYSRPFFSSELRYKEKKNTMSEIKRSYRRVRKRIESVRLIGLTSDPEGFKTHADASSSLYGESDRCTVAFNIIVVHYACAQAATRTWNVLTEIVHAKTHQR